MSSQPPVNEALTPKPRSMNLTIVSSKQVSTSPASYNTRFHTSDEFPELEAPSERPYTYTRRLRLIASSQDIPLTAIQTSTLTTGQSRLLVLASQGSLITGVPNRAFAEDISEVIVPSLSMIVYPPQGLFLRLEACSAKDSISGTKPLRCIEDIILRITTSHKAMSAIGRVLESAVEDVKLIFLPFDERMRTEREYRVFCRPVDGKITAVSQYLWHEPSVFKDRPKDGLSAIAHKIMADVKGIHAAILADVDPENEMDVLFMKQGFSFDVMYDEVSETCALIEFNVFGARSGLGGCLFHWLTDFDVLYGRKGGGESVVVDRSPTVEFRISI